MSDEDKTKEQLIRELVELRQQVKSLHTTMFEIALERERRYYSILENSFDGVVLKLRKSEELYRNLVDLSPDAIVVHSEGKIEFVNNIGVKIYGAASPYDLIGKPVLDFVHPDYREIVQERIRQMESVK